METSKIQKERLKLQNLRNTQTHTTETSIINTNSEIWKEFLGPEKNRQRSHEYMTCRTAGI